MHTNRSIDAERNAVERETALVKVQARGADVAALVTLSARAGARVLDAIGSVIIIEITDEPDIVDSFLYRLRAFGILDLARSGPVVLPRATQAPSATRPGTEGPRAPHDGPWSSYLLPIAPTPFTSQADGASDDVAA